MKLQTFQNTFPSSEEMRNDNSALLGCNRSGCHCFPDSGTSRAGTWALCQHVGYWLFWATAEFSLTWHLQGIAVLSLMTSKQHSDFPGQMRFFSLWLLLKCPHLLGLLAGSWNKYISAKLISLAKLEFSPSAFDSVPRISDSLDKPLVKSSSK